jgi:hypothetical protein
LGEFYEDVEVDEDEAGFHRGCAEATTCISIHHFSLERRIIAQTSFNGVMTGSYCYIELYGSSKKVEKSSVIPAICVSIMEVLLGTLGISSNT